MNEHGFVKAVHRQLPPWIKVWKICDDYQGGVPDALYFGQNGKLLFVEHKYVKLPKRKTTVINLDLSSLQKEWYSEMDSRRIPEIVLVGCEGGGVWVESLTEVYTGIVMKEFVNRRVSINELSGRITNRLS